jgi:predicted transcriptional regulator of viral defense system
VDSAGASRALLASLTDEGKLLKLGRGLYALPDRAASAYDSFAEVAARSENGVLCLLSALRFHDLTTQQSSDVWLAIPHRENSENALQTAAWHAEPHS